MAQKHKPEDIYWVKCGKNLWPAGRTNEYPEELTARRKKAPFAIVKYFNEDLYEVIVNEDQARPYHADEKVDLIKKNLKSMPKHLLEGFKNDILQAEGLDPSSDEGSRFFENLDNKPSKEKLDYSKIFASKPTPLPSPSPAITPTSTKPKIISKFSASTSETPKRRGRPSTKVEPSSVKPTATGPKISTSKSKKYQCREPTCSFQTDNLNIITAHTKSHTNVTPKALVENPISPSSLPLDTPYVHLDTPIGGSRVGKGTARFASVSTNASEPSGEVGISSTPSGSVSSKKRGRKPVAKPPAVSPAKASPPSIPAPKKRGRKSKEQIRLEKEALEQEAKKAIKKEDILGDWSGEEEGASKEKGDEEEDEEEEARPPMEKKQRTTNYNAMFDQLLQKKHGSQDLTEEAVVGGNEKVAEDDAEKLDENSMEVEEGGKIEEEEEKVNFGDGEVDALLRDTGSLVDRIKSIGEPSFVSSGETEPVQKKEDSEDEDVIDQEMEELIARKAAEKAKEEERKVASEKMNVQEPPPPQVEEPPPKLVPQIPAPSSLKARTPSPTKVLASQSITQAPAPTQSPTKGLDTPVLAVKSLPKIPENSKAPPAKKPQTLLPTAKPNAPVYATKSTPGGEEAKGTPATASPASSLHSRKQVGVVKPTTSPVQASGVGPIFEEIKKPTIQTQQLPPNIQSLLSSSVPSSGTSTVTTQTGTQMGDLLASGGVAPVDQIVHLLPVENADGTVTYMLLSMDQQAGLTVAQTEPPPPVVSSTGVAQVQPQVPANTFDNLSSIYVDTKDGADLDSIIRALESGACSAPNPTSTAPPASSTQAPIVVSMPQGTGTVQNIQIPISQMSQGQPQVSQGIEIEGQGNQQVLVHGGDEAFNTDWVEDIFN